MDWISSLFDRVNEKPTEEAIEYTLSLIDSSIYEERKKTRLELKVYNMTTDEIIQLITKLKDDQIDRIESGTNYQQGDIARKLNKQGL